jgi:acyl-CoA reductase-like NAD-dependent aldehyde dehydrogenase
MQSYPMVINGDLVNTNKTNEVINPAYDEPFAVVPECTVEELDYAMQSAQSAYLNWSQQEELRKESLLKAANILFQSSSEIAPLLTQEQGKPINEATMEIIGAGVWFKYFAELDLPKEVIQDDQVARVEVVRKPLGVVGAITPWNYPLILAAWKIAPALRAGNTIVLKPSPFTPVATLKLAELLQQAFPKGVLNVVTGGDELGKMIVNHKIPRKISFTGSISAGKHVAVSAAADLKNVTLELGGNDPAIVLEDVDVAEIAEKLFWGAFNNNGQVCSAIKRIYVHSSKYNELVEALANYAKGIKVGNGLEPDTKLGPINNKPQFLRVKELVQDALNNGAKAATGGRPLDSKGYFFEPTILTNVSDGMRIVDEEQFGPALPIMSYDDIEDAIKRANATNFGLSGSVWGKDIQRASSIASKLECGTAWVNAHLVLAPHQPFGGFKWSGIGVENGPWGLYSFTNIQVLYQSK